jgi:signal transduction histidine kinase
LLKSATGNDPKQEYLGTIVKEAKQLEDVLEEILNYSDSLYPVMDRWDLNKLIEDAAAAVHDRFEQAGCRCQLDLTQGLPTVLLDCKQFAYCLKLLLTAVLENRTQGGEIIVRDWITSDSAGIEILDSNGTLTPESWGYQVEPFAFTQGLGGGDEVGLALCRTILEKSGHRLELEKTPQGGMRYTILLNREKEE